MSEYRGYQIEPKRDFGTYGFLIKGEWVKTGFVVVKDGCNAMPAAAWFQTKPEAKEAIDALIVSEGDAELFWLILGNSGSNSVQIGDRTGRVTVKPCSTVAYYNEDGVRVSDRDFTPKQALALSCAIRRAAMLALGEI